MDLTRTALTRAFAHLHAASGPEDTRQMRVDLVLAVDFTVIATSFACAVVFVVAPSTPDLVWVPVVAVLFAIPFLLADYNATSAHRTHWVEWKIVADMSRRHWLADEKGEVTADWKRKDLNDRVSRLLAEAPMLSARDYEYGTRDAQCDPAWFPPYMRKAEV